MKDKREEAVRFVCNDICSALDHSLLSGSLSSQFLLVAAHHLDKVLVFAGSQDNLHVHFGLTISVLLECGEEVLRRAPALRDKSFDMRLEKILVLVEDCSVPILTKREVGYISQKKE